MCVFVHFENLESCAKNKILCMLEYHDKSSFRCYSTCEALDLMSQCKLFANEGTKSIN
jgi:hypothetical protein